MGRRDILRGCIRFDREIANANKKEFQGNALHALQFLICLSNSSKLSPSLETLLFTQPRLSIGQTKMFVGARFSLHRDFAFK